MDDERNAPPLYRALYWIGVGAVLGMMVVGLFASLTNRGRPPGIVLNYVDNIDAMLEDREYEKAAEQMRLALMIEWGGKLPPEHIELSLGNSMASHNAVSLAIRHLQRALEIKPEFPQAHYALGTVIAGRGDHARAEEHFRRAMELDNGYAAPYYGLGKLHEAAAAAATQAGEKELAAVESKQAIEYYQKAVDVFAMRKHDTDEKRSELEPDKPEFARLHNSIAMARYRDGDLDGALEHLKRALALHNRYAEAHYNAGMIYYTRLGKLQEALVHLEAAKDIDANFLQAYEAARRMLQQGPPPPRK